VALNESSDRNLTHGILPVGWGNRGAAVLGLELSDDAIHDTILQLSDVGYVEYHDISYTTGASATFVGLRVTGRGLQVLGQWPRFEALVSPATLAELVDRLVDYAASGEEPPMSRAAGVIRRAGAASLLSAAIGIGSHLLRGALGLP
jgi:hypothetical protein